MIPYIELTPMNFDFIGLGKIYWFSIFVIIGIILGVMWFDLVEPGLDGGYRRGPFRRW